jgi:hypothetical protein
MSQPNPRPAGATRRQCRFAAEILPTKNPALREVFYNCDAAKAFHDPLAAKPITPLYGAISDEFC